MNPWFIWKGKNSLSDFGLWINKLPKIIRAPERYKEITIPGRAGSLIMTEGEDVYDSYLKECTVIIRHSIDIQRVLDWLRGSGEVIFSNEIEKAYNARIAGQVAFQRISNDMSQAVIPFFVEPFKKGRYPANETITLASGTATETIYNPGDVASKPQVTITKDSAASDLTVTIGDQAMTFNSFTGTIVVDCDAGIVTENGQLWSGSFDGAFWRIPAGELTISRSAACALQIEPNWRWV